MEEDGPYKELFEAEIFYPLGIGPLKSQEFTGTSEKGLFFGFVFWIKQRKKKELKFEQKVLSDYD